MFNSATAVQESLAQNKTISFFRLLLFIRSVLLGKKEVKKDGKICSKKIKSNKRFAPSFSPGCHGKSTVT